MRRSRTVVAAAALLVLAAMPVGQAGAHGEGPTPTKVLALDVDASGAALAVTGAAKFGGEPPIQIAEDVAGDAPLVSDIGDDTGVDLIGARVYQPDPEVPEVVFE